MFGRAKMIDIVYRFDSDDRRSLLTPATAEEAKHRLEEGNRMFSGLSVSSNGAGSTESRIIPCDLSDLVAGERNEKAPKQAPFAVVLGCSDARVPTELVFGQAYNALFVVRVAGNVLGSECLGSIDYAMGHLGESLKLLVVLGHTGCGAVTAAVDAFLVPGNYLALATSHALRSVVDRISIAVRAATRALESQYGGGVTGEPGYRQALIETAVVVHAALTAYTLEMEFAGKSECRVVYGTYDLVTRKVGLHAGAAGDGDARLFAPPRDRAAFVALLEGLVSSENVRRAFDTSGGVSSDSATTA
jgi:carbonic anhydrase